MRTTLLSLSCLLLTPTGAVLAAENTPFLLGEVLVTGSDMRSGGLDGVSLDLEQMRAHQRENVGTAVNMLPGVSLSKIGARNEQMVYVRGFDLRQVPVFIDGIPVYVPYDGYVDLGRFTTFDLARIDVSRGFSSLMFGPNTLGGAINLVSRRPAPGLRGEVGGGSTFADGGDNSAYRSYINLGYGAERWYVQASASILDQDSFPLPDDFTPNAGDDGDERDNSSSKDSRLSLKLAWTPNATDEYALSYVNQQGEKGNPPYAGTVTGISRRFWDWPYWDKESLYFISTTRLGMHTLKTRLYLDEYGNALYSYDDNTYSRQTRPFAFRSVYDDNTWGASVELASQLSEDNLLKTSLQWKDDTHREQDVGAPWSENRDQTWSFAVENTRALTDNLQLSAGVAYNARESREANRWDTASRRYLEFPLGKNDGVSAQAGLSWVVSDTATVHGSVARKNRFATVKDRYSFRMGTAIPNPDLKTEQAMHYEAGIGVALDESWQWQSTVFFSEITNLMQSVRIAPTACTSAPCSQLQNVGEAESSGVELSLAGALGKTHLNASYTYVERQNLSDPTVRLTDTPLHSLFVSSRYEFSAQWSVTVSLTGASSRMNSTDGRQQSAGYSVADLSTRYALANGLVVEAGIQNLFDRLYTLSEGFPEAGRTAFVQLHWPIGR